MEKQELEEQSSEMESHGAGGAGMKIDRCPHCGSDEDYFTKDFAYGNIRSYSRFDGKEADNSEMHEFLKHRMGKIVYCGNCKKRIAKSADIEVQG